MELKSDNDFHGRGGSTMEGKFVMKGTCQVCKQEKGISELVPSYSIRKSLLSVVQRENPDWHMDGFICYTDLNHYRTEHISEILEIEKGELNQLEKDVAKSISEQETLSQNINDEYESELSFGQSVADRVASFGGSWKFIITFGVIILVWILLNTFMMFKTKPFDPYPYILLNLVLSCLAALQAPVIMMSQNRQESKDRLRSGYDYKVNLKAELEIRNLNEKLDYLINHQWKNLLEVQQMQMEMLNDLMAEKKL
jgi:uncharacterized membrane protein